MGWVHLPPAQALHAHQPAQKPTCWRGHNNSGLACVLVVIPCADGLLQDLLHPLGLQASRMAAVKSVSHNFLATDWDTPAEFQ